VQVQAQQLWALAQVLVRVLATMAPSQPAAAVAGVQLGIAYAQACTAFN
jgi:hypothetical protein